MLVVFLRIVREEYREREAPSFVTAINRAPAHISAATQFILYFTHKNILVSSEVLDSLLKL
jgi:hypothetical protein